MSLLDYISFLKEGFLYEEKGAKTKKPTAWKAELADKFKDFFPQASMPVIDKGGNALRANFAPEENLAKKQISDFFTGLKNKEGGPAFSDVKVGDPFRGKMDADYTFYDLEKGIETKNAEVGSGQFDTYRVDCDSYVFYVVNTGSTGKTVGKKKTTPAALGLAGEGMRWFDAASLLSDIDRQLKDNSKVPNPAVAAYLLDCAQTVMDKTKPKWNDVNDLLAVQEKWTSGDLSLSNEHPKISGEDKKDLVNDFGEVLDAVYLLSSIKKLDANSDPTLYGLQFPSASNEALADILVDGVRISAKSEKKGGKPSIQPVIAEAIQQNPSDKKAQGISLSSEETELLEMFKHVNSQLKVGQWYDSVEVYLYFAEQMSPRMAPIVMKRLEHLKGVIGEDLSKACVVNYLDETLKTPAKKKEFIEEYWKATGFNAKKKPNYNKKGLDLIAAVYYPLAVEVVDALNKSYGGTDKALTGLIRKYVLYKQMYLGIDVKSEPDVIRISGVSSMYVPSVEFYARASSNTWNAGLGFEWVV
jgi:hypothetical protein